MEQPKRKPTIADLKVAMYATGYNHFSIRFNKHTVHYELWVTEDVRSEAGFPALWEVVGTLNISAGEGSPYFCIIDPLPGIKVGLVYYLNNVT